MTDARIIFFINPDSQGVKRKGSRLESFAASHSDMGITCLYAKGDAQLKAELSALKLTPNDHLFIEGGDGTMSRTLGTLMNLLESAADCPKLSLVAGGLTNQIATNIGLRSKRESQILRAITSPDQGLRPTPIVKVKSGTQTHYGCLFSTGAMPFVTEFYIGQIRDSSAGGGPAIAATVFKAAAGSKEQRDKLMPATPLSLTLRSGEAEKLKTGAHLGTIVTTLPSLMMGLDPFWSVKGERSLTGDLRVFYASDRARRLVRNIAGLWLSGLKLARKNKDRSRDGLESYEAETLEYHYTGPALLDGEPLKLASNFELSATIPLPFVTGS